MMALTGGAHCLAESSGALGVGVGCLGQSLTCPGTLGMLDFQQVPLGSAKTLPFLEEHCRESADSSLQCGVAWGAVCAPQATYVP